MLHWIKQITAIHVEEVMHMEVRSRYICDKRYLKEKIWSQTRTIIGGYHDAINNYLKARIRYLKAHVPNEIRQPRKQKQVH